MPFVTLAVFFVVLFNIVVRMPRSWYAFICILWLLHALCPHLVVNLYISYYQKHAHAARTFNGAVDPTRHIAIVSGNGGPGSPHITAICKENACGKYVVTPCLLHPNTILCIGTPSSHATPRHCNDCVDRAGRASLGSNIELDNNLTPKPSH